MLLVYKSSASLPKCGAHLAWDLESIASAEEPQREDLASVRGGRLDPWGALSQGLPYST